MVQCCICREEGTEKPYKKIGVFTLNRCARCGLVYLKGDHAHKDNFILSAREDLHKDHKEKVEYWSFPHLYEKYKDVFTYYFEERLRRIKRLKPDSASLFDIGCGYGFWLDYCKKKGIEVNGLDISEEVIAYARQSLGLDVTVSSLDGYEFTKQYDIMVMCDLLEHIPEPNQQLKKIYHNLTKTGIVFIQVPNLLGFAMPLFHGFGLPYHIWQFNIVTLKKLLKKNGFIVYAWWTGVMGVIGVYESGGPTLFDRIGWQLARRLKIGNRLMVVAGKQ